MYKNVLEAIILVLCCLNIKEITETSWNVLYVMAFQSHTLWGFYPDNIEMQSGDPVGFGTGLFKHTRNCASVASCGCHNLLLLPPTAT